MQYVSRNPLIPTLQNLARFNEVIKTVNLKHINTNPNVANENVKLLNDKDTLNAFLLDIQRIINESNYNTKNAIIADVKDILFSLKLLSNNTKNDNAKQQLQNAVNNISEHVKISNSLLELINDITNDNISQDYITTIFKTLDKSTIYAKYEKSITETINSIFSSNKKTSLINKTLNTVILNYRSNIKKTVALKTKLLNSTTVIYSKLRKISTYFKNFLSTSWKAITSSISLVTKKLSSLTRSISTIVIGLFKAIFNFVAYITKTLMSVTNLLTGFIAKNVVGIISNALSCIWGFLKTQQGIQTITFISGYIYGRYIKGKFKAYIGSISNINGPLTKLIQEKIENIKNKIFHEIGNSTIFLRSKAVVENIINDVTNIAGTLGSNLKIGASILLEYKDFGEKIQDSLKESSSIAELVINNKDVLATTAKIYSRVKKYGTIALGTFKFAKGFTVLGAKVGAGLAAGPAALVTGTVLGLVKFADTAYNKIVKQAAQSLGTAHAINYMQHNAIVNSSKAHQEVMSEFRSLNAYSNEYNMAMSNLTTVMNVAHNKIKNKKNKQDFSIPTLPGILNTDRLEKLSPLTKSGILSMHYAGHDVVYSKRNALINNNSALGHFITGYNKAASTEINKLVSGSDHMKKLHDRYLSLQSEIEIQDLQKAVAEKGLIHSATLNGKTVGFAPSIKNILFSKDKAFKEQYNNDKQFAADVDNYLKLIYEQLKTESINERSYNYARNILSKQDVGIPDKEDTKEYTQDELDNLILSVQQELTLGKNPFDINFLVANPIDKSADTKSPSLFDMASQNVQSVTSSIQRTAKGLMKDIGLDMAKLIDFISFTSDGAEQLAMTNLTNTKESTNIAFNILIKQPEAFIKH